jgi:predicted porin
MKIISRLLVAAAVIFCTSVIITGRVRAADAAGPAPSCCLDLEERVAELEATVARKGNRKVTLEVYGQVSKGILWVEDGGDAKVLDNPNSQSRVGFIGRGRVSPTVTVGYQVEIGTSPGSLGLPGAFDWNAVGTHDRDLNLRHSFVWAETAAGKVSLGLTSMATDAIAEISTANTAVAVLPTTLYGGLIDGPRRNVVRYDTPTLAGFTASASWASEDAWDVALRYAGDFAGFRFAAGLGYAKDVLADAGKATRVSGSASAMHMPTGIFLTGAYGHVDELDVDVSHLTGGIERKWIDLGATTLFAEFGQLDALGNKVGDGWGFGAVQNLTSVNADLFAGFRSLEETAVVYGGARLKF